VSFQREGGVLTRRLSVVIPTQNNENTLPAALASVAFADEIIVLDSGSVDRTRDIALGVGARVVERRYRSDGDQRNAGWAEATGAWVLALDSDEALDSVLAEAVRGVVSRDPGAGEPVAYALRFRSYFLGFPLDHGGLDHDEHVRLGRRERTRWESTLHSRALVDGAVGRLPGVVDHFTGTELPARLRKLAVYAADRAERMRASGVRPSVPRGLWQSLRFFLGRFVIRGGWRDGLPGAAWWWLQSTEILLAHLLLYRRSHLGCNPEDPPSSVSGGAE
jgi:glycosyltransferase involved in cell wall biosynthesis